MGRGWNTKRLARRLLPAIAIPVMLSLPASASAMEISTAQVQIGVLTVTANQSVANELGVTWVTSPGGKPDLAIGDTRAGISGPVPFPCVEVDGTTARCPADLFTSLDVDLGPGPDSIGVAPAAGVDGFIRMKLSLGPGRDRAQDLGQTRDVWNGGRGRDQLNSGPLNDKVNGGSEDDIINCGPGPDDLGIGGPGRLDLSKNCEVVKH